MSKKRKQPAVTEQLRLEEIKKVFSVFDKDADGAINRKELALVLKNIGGAEVSPQELEALMNKMDKNKDGLITFEEFHAALNTWLTEEEKSEIKAGPSKKGKNKVSPHKAREAIHQRISTFFTQFKKHSNFDQVREQLQKKTQTGQAEHTGNLVTFTDQEKLARVTQSRKLIENIAEIRSGINSNDVGLAYRCTKGLAEILSVCEVYPTSKERYEIGEFLIQLFQRIGEAAVIPRVVNFLTVSQIPKLQFEAARVITFWGPGPRIAHTPIDSILHPAKCLHKSEVIRSGAGHHLCKLSVSPVNQVREQAVVAIGQLVSYDPEVRDFFLTLGIYGVLLDQINDGTPQELLYKITYTLSVFCGHTHPYEKPPKHEVVASEKALQKYAYLFWKSEEKVLENVCIALQYILPGMQVEDSIAGRLVALLAHPSSKIQSIVLKIMTDILRYDEKGLQKILQLQVLNSVAKLLATTEEPPVRLDAIELVTVIAGEKGYIQTVVDSGVSKQLIRLLTEDENARWKIAKVLNFLSRGLPQTITYLVENEDLVRHLANNLSQFRNFDSVLRDVYGFLGPSFNFEFVHDIVSTLDNILKAGDINTIETEHPYVKYYDMEVVDKIKQVMDVLSGESSYLTDSWRKTQEGKSATLEELLQSLLQKIKEIYGKCKDKSLGVHMSKEIETIQKKFTASLRENYAKIERARAQKKLESQPSPPHYSSSRDIKSPLSTPSLLSDYKSGGDITIKCFFEGDNRVLTVDRAISLRDLVLRIQLKYGKSFILQYEDAEGDKISIDSPELLKKAFSSMKDGHYRLHLLPIKTASGSTSVPSEFMPSSPVDSKTGSLLSAFAPKTHVIDTKHALMDELVKKTNFNKTDLTALYRQFQRNSTGGRLNNLQFAKELREMGEKDEVKIAQLFAAFDYDKDGFVDFRDFAAGLSIFFKGSLEEKLQLAFFAHDLDGNGVIDRDELFSILKSSFRAKGFDESDEGIRDMVNKCFETADQNGDDKLDFEEFKMAVLRHQIVVQSFWRS